MRDHFFLIVASTLLPCLLCMGTPDPLCANMNCPAGQMCRAIKPCGRMEQCNITVACVTASNAREAGCTLGHPVLFEENGVQDLLTCYMESPCPSNGYCSTVLMDVSSVCCRADPAQTVKEGTCPPPRPNPSRFFCVDQCRSDSDCYYAEKCCHTGCMTQCVRPLNILILPPPTDIPPPDIAPLLLNDPCASLNCPSNKVCRPFKPCGRMEQCDVTYICTAKEATRGGCKFGTPILIREDGTKKDLTCYTESPCPSNAYCSTELQDVSSVCCVSDPALTVKEGTCPSFTPDPTRFFCVDQCKSDGDCYYNEKCCNTGCMTECVPPASATPPPPPTTIAPPLPADPCDNTACPFMTYCRRHGQSCRSIWQCRPEGQCVPCAITPPRRGYTMILDPDGCPALVPIRRPPFQRAPVPAAPVTNMNDFLFWLWSLN